MSLVNRGDFSRVPLSDWDKQMIQSAFEAIESVPDGWEFLRTYDPGHGGFMFSSPPPKMEEINKAVLDRYGGHSGASYGMTMRNMEFIAKQGWDAYVARVLSKRQPVTTAGVSAQAAPAAPPAQGVAAVSLANACFCHRQRGLPGWCGVAGGGVPACDH